MDFMLVRRLRAEVWKHFSDVKLKRLLSEAANAIEHLQEQLEDQKSQVNETWVNCQQRNEVKVERYLSKQQIEYIDETSK